MEKKVPKIQKPGQRVHKQLAEAREAKAQRAQFTRTGKTGDLAALLKEKYQREKRFG